MSITVLKIEVVGGYTHGSVTYGSAKYHDGKWYYAAAAIDATYRHSILIKDPENGQNPDGNMALQKAGGAEQACTRTGQAYFQTLADSWNTWVNGVNAVIDALNVILEFFGLPTIPTIEPYTAADVAASIAQKAGVDQNDLMAGKYFASPELAEGGEYQILYRLAAGGAPVSQDLIVLAYDVDADTDRDGNLPENNADGGEALETEKVRFLASTGAVILANTDFDGNVTVGWHRDCDDGVINGQTDLQDVGRISLRKLGVPVASIPDALTVVVELAKPDGDTVDIDARERVRVFAEHSADPAKGVAILGTDPQTATVTYKKTPGQGERDISEHAGDGHLILGVEGLEYGTEVVVRITVKLADEAMGAPDEARLLVAPFLVRPSTASPAVVWHVDGNATLLKHLQTAGVPPGQLSPPAGADVFFAQDAMEIGHSCMTQGGATTSMPSVLSLPRKEKMNDVIAMRTAVRDFCKQQGYGFYFVKGRDSDMGGQNYGGNIELAPSSGSEEPYGRVLIGQNADQWLKDFFTRQDAQTPLVEVNVAAVGLGHVDEILTFAGSKMILGNPMAGIQELRRLKQGDFPDLPADPDAIQAAQQQCIDAINASVRTPVANALGLSAADIVEVPVFFGLGQLASGTYDASTSNPANMLVTSSHTIVPDPFGLWFYGERNGVTYHGEDLNGNGQLDPGEDENGNQELDEHFFLKEYVRNQLAGAGTSAHFIDCTGYHAVGGEIHCATNSTRQ